MRPTRSAAHRGRWAGDEFAQRLPSYEHDLHDTTSKHRARSRVVHRERAELRTRAPRALLPDARLLRGVGGPRSGDLPARVARACHLRGPLRAWLYRIATNACLDALDKRPRAVSASGEVLWLQPYPDELLEELADAVE